MKDKHEAERPANKPEGGTGMSSDLERLIRMSCHMDGDYVVVAVFKLTWPSGLERRLEVPAPSDNTGFPGLILAAQVASMCIDELIAEVGEGDEVEVEMSSELIHVSILSASASVPLMERSKGDMQA